MTERVVELDDEGLPVPFELSPLTDSELSARIDLAYLRAGQWLAYALSTPPVHRRDAAGRAEAAARHASRLRHALYHREHPRSSGEDFR